MDFDQMLEAWKAQDDKPPYDVNRDALRQALHAEEVRVRRELRVHRGGVWFTGILGAGLAVWAGFWIAIVITNGWPVVYAITAGLSLVIFAFGVGALWVSRGPRAEPEPNFGNTLQEEVRRTLALVDHQLSLTGRWLLLLLGTASIVVGVALFSWTLDRSQDMTKSSGVGWFLFAFVFGGLPLWASYRQRDAMREAKSKLELRRQRLHELLENLDAVD